ncbi:MAG: egtC 2 [Microbacteriaceae bacterium]|nr:egtC 2 [Microbacteriaceae bacterium]
MCRLLGVVSSSSGSLRNMLGDNLAPFSALSESHCDGWGEASWTDSGRLTVEKEPVRAATSDRFASTMTGTVTDAALLHLRRASAGMVNQVGNTHPFTDGQIAFAHNGWCGPIEELDRLVAEVGGRPCDGDTDSERYFRLVSAELAEAEPEFAIPRAAARIMASAQFEALNALLLTPTALYAYSYFNEEAMRARGVADDAYDLHYSIEDSQVTIASTGWDRDPERWTALPKGAVLEVMRSEDGRQPEVRVLEPASLRP